jgi:hypothetical protein
MQRNVAAASLTVWLCISGGAALAHHSVVVNFDTSKNLDVSGRVTEVDIRNPHSQITLEVTSPDGSVRDWFIEWSDRNSLIRRRVPFDLIRVGDTLTINVSPSRRLDNVGYFRAAVLPDKSVLRDCGFGAFREAVANARDISCEPESAR